MKINKNVTSLGNSIQLLKMIVGKTVSGIYVVMWPPLGEDNPRNIILALILELETGECLLIDTDDNQYSILVKEISKETHDYVLSEIEGRISFWMHHSDTDLPILKNEVFLVNANSTLGDKIGREIKSIILLNIGEEDLNPYGVKIIFENDSYIFSFSSTYGNSIQSERFMNFLNPLKVNEHLGNCLELDVNLIN